MIIRGLVESRKGRQSIVPCLGIGADIVFFGGSRVYCHCELKSLRCEILEKWSVFLLNRAMSWVMQIPAIRIS